MQRGGVLGRPLKLEVFDHCGNPARGLDNMETLGKRKDALAVLGGIHTPVAMHQLKAIHKYRLIYLGPWAAGTSIVRNGFSPNYVLRVSLRNEYAGGFLVGQSKKSGHKIVGLLLERTGWGRSNERAMKDAARRLKVSIALIE